MQTADGIEPSGCKGRSTRPLYRRVLLALTLSLTLGACSDQQELPRDESATPAVQDSTVASTDAAGHPDAPESASPAAPPDGHSSRDSLDWAGTYSGVLPCASCPGIETTITLNADGTFRRSLLYIDEQTQPDVSTGTFSWDAAGRTVTLQGDGDDAQQYQVGENLLFHLDRDGRRIEGDLAANYQLHKHLNDPRIEDRRWVLVELRGQPLPTSASGPAVFMVLGAQDFVVSGHASCNTFSGAYAIKSGDRISFDRNMAVTLMACPDMDLEGQFLEVLAMVDNYSVGEDGRLSLNRARMAPLARFENAGLVE